MDIAPFLREAWFFDSSSIKKLPHTWFLIHGERVNGIRLILKKDLFSSDLLILLNRLSSYFFELSYHSFRIWQLYQFTLYLLFIMKYLVQALSVAAWTALAPAQRKDYRHHLLRSAGKRAEALQAPLSVTEFGDLRSGFFLFCCFTTRK